jgi:DNA-binding LytR/AlgR family response regulator
MPSSYWWTSQPGNIEKVLAMYRHQDNLSASKIARQLKTQIHNVCDILRRHLDQDEYRELKARRWSIAKRGEKHPRWEPDRDLVKRPRVVRFQTGDRIYRQRMADLLGLERLPSHVDVHHIDGDPTNNALDNLAIMTPEAHMRLHGHQPPKRKRRVLWMKEIHDD